MRKALECIQYYRNLLQQVAHAGNISTQKVEEKNMKFKSDPWLRNKFKASLGNIKLCLANLNWEANKMAQRVKALASLWTWVKFLILT